MLKLDPEDLPELGADQLHIISGNQESNPLLGKLWRAVKVPGDASDCIGRSEPPALASTEWRTTRRSPPPRKLSDAVTEDTASAPDFGRLLLKKREIEISF